MVATLIVETVFGGVPLWVMILIAVALGAVAIPLMFGREIKGWYQKLVANSPNLPGDLIPLIDGITMAWSKIRSESKMLQENPFEGDLVAKFIVDEMLGDDPPAVQLYAISAPLTKVEIISHVHEYAFDDDCSAAVHVQEERNKLTKLQVRRSDVERWIKSYLGEEG